MLLRVIPLLVLGAGLGAILGAIVVGDPGYMIVASLAIPAFIVLRVVAGSQGLTMRGTGLALARVETIQRTGIETNGMQQCRLRLVVAPPRGGAYQTTTTYFVTPEQLRTIVPGSVLVVSRANATRPDVTVVSNPPAEWISKVEAARINPTTVPPSSAAPEWGQHPVPTPPQRSRGVGIALGIVAVVAGAALALIPAYGSLARAATSFAAGDWDGTSMVTGNYQQLAVDELASVAGGHLFTEISFYDSYVIATAPTTPGADTTDDFMWRYGHAFRDGPELIQPQDLKAELFDASTIDFSLVGPLTEQAKRESGLDNINSVYPRIAMDTTGAGVPKFMIYVGNDYKDVSFVFSTDGTLVNTY